MCFGFVYTLTLCQPPQTRGVAGGLVTWALGPPPASSNPAPAAADPVRLATAMIALLRSFEGHRESTAATQRLNASDLPGPGQDAQALADDDAAREAGEILTTPISAAEHPEVLLPDLESSSTQQGAPAHLRDSLPDADGADLGSKAAPEDGRGRASAPGVGGAEGADVERAGVDGDPDRQAGWVREAHLACLARVRGLLRRRGLSDAAEQVQAALLAALLAQPQARLPERALRAFGHACWGGIKTQSDLLPTLLAEPQAHA